MVILQAFMTSEKYRAWQTSCLEISASHVTLKCTMTSRDMEDIVA